MITKLHKMLIITALLVLVRPGALAQLTEASISGVILDQQGALVAGAEVVALNVETGVKTSTMTNQTGFYSIRPLPIGRYTVSAKISGFRQYLREGIVLSTGQAVELNISLMVGSVEESVTVSANASMLETREAGVDQLIESKTIEDVPLGDRRAMNIIEMTGAAVFVDYANTIAKPQFVLAGGRAQSQGFFIDGGNAQNMRIGIGQMDMDPPIEALQEVKIMANGFSAEFGGSASGVVVAHTKSGTNRLTGSLFDYFRHQKLDAANLFAPVVDGKKQKPPLRYSVIGGTLGGPIRRDKTFFFFSYEGSRRRDGSIRSLTVPTMLERGGDFSQSYNLRGKTLIYDPATGRAEGNRVVRDPFAGNRIPASRIDPVALKLVPFFPLPNRTPDDASGANNFRANDVTLWVRDNFVVKIDHNLDSSNKFTARYLYNSDDNAPRSVYPDPAADTKNQIDAHQQFWYGNWTRILNPSIVQETRFSYGTRLYYTHSMGLGGGWPSKVGLKGVADDFFPRIVPGGYAALGSPSQANDSSPIEQLQILSSTSWVHGRHSVRFGGEARRSRISVRLRQSASGSYNFAVGMTGAVGMPNTGNGFATFLVGVPTNFQTRESDSIDRSSWYLAGFIQDDWTLRHGLTLNLGVRWEADTPFRDANNRLNGFDAGALNPVSLTPGVVKFAGVNGWRTSPYNPDWNNLAPRAGFAWQPFARKKTVLRGAFGIFYAHPFDASAAAAATLGFERAASLILQPNSPAVPYTLGGGLPIPDLKAPLLDDSFGAARFGQTATQSVTFFDPQRRTGYSLQFNLSVQHELPGRILIDVGYLGNMSRKLPGENLTLNQIRPEKLGPGAGQWDRPFPQFSNVQIQYPAIGVSAYNAGVVRVEKRFSGGFNLLATYTWAKFLDNSNSPGGSLGDEVSAYSNQYNRRPDWGPSENDIRQRFTWGSVWQLPFGPGRALVRTHALRHIAAGWSLGSMVTLQGGAPVTVTTQTNTSYSYSAGNQRADVLRNPEVPRAERTLLRWFDVDAFRQPASYAFGNEGIGLVRADGIVNLNCSIIRAIKLAERKQLRFRGDLFNVINHPNFRLPGHVFGASGFGVVAAARPARQVQLGLQLTF